MIEGLIWVAAGLGDTSFSCVLLESLRRVVKKQLQAKLVRMTNAKKSQSHASIVVLVMYMKSDAY
jgi:hypothetical protein